MWLFKKKYILKAGAASFSVLSSTENFHFSTPGCSLHCLLIVVGEPQVGSL